MREQTTKGIICFDYNDQQYRVARIQYTIREDESFTYTFYPNYTEIDAIPTNIFPGIQGVDLDLRKDCYVRNNITPCFISERTPSPNREDLVELLNKVNMSYLDPLEWLIRTDLQYFGDPLYVIRDNT